MIHTSAAVADNPVCLSVNNRNEQTQKTIFDRAKESFLAGLSFQERKLIHGPEDIGSTEISEFEKLPSSIQSNMGAPMSQKAIATKYTAYLQEKKESFTLYAEYEKALYDASNEGTAEGLHLVSPQSVEKRVTEIAQLLIGQIKKENTFNASQKEEIIDKLSHAKTLTFTSLRDEPESNRKSAERAELLDLCGNDLSLFNAEMIRVPHDADLIFVRPNSNPAIRAGAKLDAVLLICPAVATAGAALQNKEQAIDFFLAHELGHLVTGSVDSSNEEPEDLDNDLLAAQNNYTACLQSRYGTQFRSLPDVMNILEPIYDRQKNSLATLLHSKEVATMLEAAKELKEFEKYYRKVPTSVDSHASELLADRWATRVVAPLVDNNAANYLAGFCRKSETVQAGIGDGDEGIHPSYSFRIENFLRSLPSNSVDKSCDDE
jgi:hypothetical protein